jgi:hypothetical protein
MKPTIFEFRLLMMRAAVIALLAGSLTCLNGATVVAWGPGSFGQTNVPAGLSNAVAIDGGAEQSLAIRSDGTVVAWGSYDNNDGRGSQPMFVPEGLSNVIAIACGGWFNVALRSDGTVVAWGYNGDGQGDVPAGLSNVVAVSAAAWCGFALQANGKVIGWGSTVGPGSAPITVPASLGDVVAISGGGFHYVVLRADGTVKAWGDNFYGQLQIPANLGKAIAVAAGGDHTAALRSNGTVAAWGANYYGQIKIPPGLSNVVAIASGDLHSMALRSDGTVVAWGYTDRTNVPPGLSNVVAIAGGMTHSLAIVGPVSPLALTTIWPNTTTLFFRQTGLMEQRVRVYNTTAFPFPATRIVVNGLSSGATVYNLSGVNAQGLPYIQYNQPIAPGGSIDLTIEYYVPLRSVPSVTLTSEVVEPAVVPTPVGTVQAVTRSLRLDDGSYLVDFRTLSNRTYYVQYSADLQNWKTAMPGITGTGSGVQWVDNGPPKTDSWPGTQAGRFYRVLLAP